MAEVRHRVGIRGSIVSIFDAIAEPAGISKWWATSASGAPEVGANLELTFGDLATLSFVFRDLRTNSLVHLKCSSGPFPWPGSQIRFTLEETDGQVFVTLEHRNDDADREAFLYFNTKWPMYLLSLRDLIETGNGRPYPNDIKIHHGD